MPSSATRGVVSVTRDNGRVVKKRIIEQTGSDPRIPPPSAPDDNTFNTQMNFSQPSNEQADKQDTPNEPPSGNLSRSVSVSATVFASSILIYAFPGSNPSVA